MYLFTTFSEVMSYRISSDLGITLGTYICVYPERGGAGNGQFSLARGGICFESTQSARAVLVAAARIIPPGKQVYKPP